MRQYREGEQVRYNRTGEVCKVGRIDYHRGTYWFTVYGQYGGQIGMFTQPAFLDYFEPIEEEEQNA